MNPKILKVLVTGATGFVGKPLIHQLNKEQRFEVVASVRTRTDALLLVQQKIIGNISSKTDWKKALFGCEVVIHTAARVHVMKESAPDPLLEFRKVNVEGTLNLAKQAVKQGVKRFIFISSIKVNGEVTDNNTKFSAEDSPNPQDPYAISKYEAEQALLKLAEETGLEVVIIRPPLIYGPEVKGNFKRLMQLVQKRWPLPFGDLNQNKRSLVSIYNLIDLIIHCIEHPNAANNIFLVSDGHDLSLVELLEMLGQALGKSPRLFYIPQGLLKGLARFIGKENIWQRLGGSLQINVDKTCEVLSWKPAWGVEESLKKTIHNS